MVGVVDDVGCLELINLGGVDRGKNKSGEYNLRIGDRGKKIEGSGFRR